MESCFFLLFCFLAFESILVGLEEDAFRDSAIEYGSSEGQVVFIVEFPEDYFDLFLVLLLVGFVLGFEVMFEEFIFQYF